MKTPARLTPRLNLTGAIALLARVLAISPALISSARAELVARDTFDSYTSGAALNNATGGTGWSAPWTAVSGVSISSTALTHVVGDRMLGGGNSLKIAASNDSALHRALPTDASGRDYYVSFLFRIEGGTAGSPVSGSVFTGWQAQDGAPSATNDSIGFLGAAGAAGARVNNVSSSFATPLNYGQTYFFVIKYTGWNNPSANYSTVKVWLNPASTDEPTTTSTITQQRTEATSGAGSSSFSGIRVRSVGLSSSVYYLVDDLRIGTSWVDVVSPHRDLIVFGDSYSGQSGPMGPTTQPEPTSTNGGYPRQTWIQQLSPMLNFGTLANATAPAGGNYAIGGHQTSDMVGRITTYLADVDGTANAEATYFIWCGGNDILSKVGTVSTAQLASVTSAAAITAADRVKTQTARLLDAGARSVVWLNLGDLGQTPFASTFPAADQAAIRAALTAASNDYNQRLDDNWISLTASYPQATLQVMDAHALFAAMQASPSTYGFTNVTGYSPSNDYLFFDRIHPTSHGHYEIANYAYQTVGVPVAKCAFITTQRSSPSRFGFSGWGASGSSSAATTYTNVTLGTASTTPRLGVHSVNGFGGEAGVLFAHSGTSATAASRNDRFVITHLLPVAQSIVGRDLTLRWRQAFSNTLTKVRVIVRMPGGAWYASAAEFGVSTASSGGSMTNAETKTLNFSSPTVGINTSQWTQITFGEGAPIVRSTTAVVPDPGTSDLVTAYGFLIVTDNAANQAAFIDDIELISGNLP